jgi:thiol:disulfide interchange protein DsbD
LRLSGLGLLCALALPAFAGLWDQPQNAAAPLRVDEAFRLLPIEHRDGQLRVEWDVAPGYYLYRGRLSIAELRDGIEHPLKAALPKGHPYHDEHFGDVEIYRGDLVVTVPAASATRRLRVRYQGCADAGICYPPQQADVSVPPA